MTQQADTSYRALVDKDVPMRTHKEVTLEVELRTVQ